MSPDFCFEILTTADGSPTIRLWRDTQPAECMHHLGGALSESIYIYDTALKFTQENHRHGVRILSVGLGLGYNELLVFARFTQNKFNSFYMESFESDPWLRQAFSDWLTDQAAQDPQWRELFDRVCQSVAGHYQILPALLKAELLKQREAGRWTLRATLDDRTEFKEPFTCILFDAFSKAATPGLWTEEFLDGFLAKAAGPRCVLTTYAATGALKRSLKKSGFKVEMKTGFAGKRQSTWGVKGLTEKS